MKHGITGYQINICRALVAKQQRFFRANLEARTSRYLDNVWLNSYMGRGMFDVASTDGVS